MTVHEALAEIAPVTAQSYILQKIQQGRLSVLDSHLYNGESKEEVKFIVDKYRKEHKAAKSDPEHWHTLGKLAYWQMVENIVMAADINDGVLADVEKPDTNGEMVMVAIEMQQQYGIKVYNETVNLQKRKKNG